MEQRTRDRSCLPGEKQVGARKKKDVRPFLRADLRTKNRQYHSPSNYDFGDRLISSARGKSYEYRP